MFQYTIVRSEDEQFVTVYAPGRDPLPASSSHPNFNKIIAACVASTQGEDVSADEVADLFDVAAAVSRKFQRLSERVTVNADGIFLDGDPVHGTLQTQILDFLDSGDDFGPLVNFYEKLTTNPLGDVRDGLYDWIKGQTANGGKLTITPEGDIIGYKSLQSQSPEWRTDEQMVWVPSRRGEGIVNGVEVDAGQFIEQVPGDVVEMPRSRVLHAPSQACGDGLHIGTFEYAQSFYGGNTVMAVKFSPRDIVSLPDRNSTWKLRVCRYDVIGPVEAPLDVPVFLTAPVEPENADNVVVGTRLKDEAGDMATVTRIDGQDIHIQWDNSRFGANGHQVVDRDMIGDNDIVFFAVVTDNEDDEPMDLTFEPGDRVEDADGDQGIVVGGLDPDGDIEIEYDNPEFGTDYASAATTTNLSRPHGKGGPTSQAAKGRGRNPAQDDKGRFSGGRPGSPRDASTGRFA